jgi:Rhodopirellula transposase DDE domain
MIAATTTRTGLCVHAELSYPTGIRVSDAALAALPITRHAFHGMELHPAPAPHRHRSCRNGRAAGRNC